MRKILFLIAYPFLWVIGKLKIEPKIRLIGFSHYFKLRKIVRSGGVLLSRKKGEASNLFISGFYKHTALVTDKKSIFEAVSTGGVRKSLLKFLLDKDYVAYLEPSFTDEKGMLLAARNHVNFLGLPYDYFFEEDDRAIYCSEAVVDCYTGQVPADFGKMVLGEKTYYPDAFYVRNDLWTLKWESKR